MKSYSGNVVTPQQLEEAKTQLRENHNTAVSTLSNRIRRLENIVAGTITSTIVLVIIFAVYATATQTH